MQISIHYSTNWSKLLCLGLTEEDMKVISEVGGSDYKLLPVDNIPHAELMEMINSQASDALMLWLSDEAWENLHTNAPHILEAISFIPCVLIVSEFCATERLSRIMDDNFQQILRSPLDKEAIISILYRANVARDDQYYDSSKVTKELLLTRDLLERKADVLSFMLNFFKGIDSAATVAEAFEHARFSFESAFPLHSMQLAWWGTENKHNSIQYILGTKNEYSPVAKAWIDILTKCSNALIYQQAELINNKFIKKDIHTDIDYMLSDFPYEHINSELELFPLVHCLGNFNSFEVMPANGNLTFLPLSLPNTPMKGLLILQTMEEVNCSKDLTLAIEAVRSHFSTILSTLFDEDKVIELYTEKTNSHQYVAPSNVIL